VAGAAPSAEVCWLVGSGGTVLLTVDGEQWKKTTPPTASDLESISARDEYSAVVVSNEGKSFVTDDGGKSWRLSRN